MNYEALFSSAGDKVVRVGLVGVGDFGASLLAQSRTIPNLEICVVCDRDAGRMEAVVASGLGTGDIVMTGDITEDGLPDFDVLVEATGHPQAAAAVAEWAIERGRHVVMASKEAAIVAGPILHEMARQKGVVYTEVEGDQPSLLIGLISWAKTLGLTVIAAGKSSEYDFVLDDDDSVDWCGQKRTGSGLRSLWQESGQGWSDLCANRQAALAAAGLPTRTVPDFCEMGVVANATGLVADRPDFHAPLLRAGEVADAFRPKAEGGLMEGAGRIDVFNCFRRLDEASFAGGVFVVVPCDDEKTWALLKDKGHMVSGDGRTAMLYNPQHLLGVEAPISILSAGLLGLPTGATAPRPVVDLAARTKRDFKKGEVLAITDAHHHEVDGLSPELVAARPLADANPCPYYLAVDRTLTEDVSAGALITASMLDLDPEQPLSRLRRRQDRAFLA